jgi:hypothetical protein
VKRTVTRRKKPGRRELDEFLRTGTLRHDPREHEVSPKARRTDLRVASDDVKRLLRRYLGGNASLELTILRGHLVLEYLLNQFIRFMAPVEVDPEGLRLTFSQKVDVFHILGALPDPQLFVTLELWNRLRNQLAHRLDFDRTLVDQLIRVNSEAGQGKLSDRQRASRLRALAGYYAGAIMSCIEAAAAMDAHEAKGGLTKP